MMPPPPPAMPLSPMAHLTPRQKEVLMWLAAGVGTRGIAEKLHISHYTVKTHISNILLTLGASSQAHAVAIALRHGIIK